MRNDRSEVYSWPRWPQIDSSTIEAVTVALNTSEQSVTRVASPEVSMERRFAEEFAKFSGANFGVSVDHGSSALVIALQALGIRRGDQVIVPVLGWVAPATAVLRVGAEPVFADVDERSGCLTAQTVRVALTPRTRAVIIVHLACTTADTFEITKITDEIGVQVIEDCSQAHGGYHRDGTQVGTLGEIGIFSLGAAKAISGGEAGICVTNDRDLYRRLQMLRADSRRYAEGQVPVGAPVLVEDGSTMGANFCMSEVTAALLIDQLEKFPNQVATRAARLSDFIEGLPGYIYTPASESKYQPAVYELAIQFDPAIPSEVIDAVCRDSRPCIGIELYRPRVPLNRSPLFHPENNPTYVESISRNIFETGLRAAYGGAEMYVDRTCLVHHRALLASKELISVMTEYLSRKTEHATRVD